MNAIDTMLRTGTLVVALTLLGGCGDPTGSDHDEPNIASVAITRGTNTVEVGSVQSGTLSLTAGASPPVSVRVLNAAGADDPVVMADAEDYEIRIVQAAASRFTAVGSAYPYTGTITPGPTTGQAVYSVQVYSKEHGHVEFQGTLTIMVTAATGQ